MFLGKCIARFFQIRRFGAAGILLLLAVAIPQASPGPTVSATYPDLASGILGSARLVPLEGDTLLVADNVKITKADLLAVVGLQEPGLVRQLEKNLFFVLEQEATRRVLANEAKKAGITDSNGDEDEMIRKLFAGKSAAVTVSDAELREFYQNGRDMMGGAPFESVEAGIRQYLLQAKQEQAVVAYLSAMMGSLQLSINADWVASQNTLALDNPVDNARSSKKPTMVEFGAAGCIPCDMMQPILETLRKKHGNTLNVVFVHVGEEQVLASRYDISSIPVQVFFDAEGQEVFRHVGFFAETEIAKQLAQIGIQ
jgi:thioredoxin 1